MTSGWSGLHACSELPSGTEIEYFYPWLMVTERYDRSVTLAFQKAAGTEFVDDNGARAGLRFHALQRRSLVRLILGPAWSRSA